MNAWAWLALLVCANALLLGLPMLPALLEWRRRDMQPLHIPADDESGIEYFATRFRQRLLADWAGDPFFLPSAGTPACDARPVAQVPAGAGYLVAEPGNAIAGMRRAPHVREPVLVGDAVRLADGGDYLGDIYARRELRAAGGSLIRSVLCDGDVELGPGCGILRWAHARRLRIGPGSRATGRLSAQELIAIGPDCGFERLKAPAILLGDAQQAARLPAGTAVGSSDGSATSSAVVGGLDWHAATGRWTCDGDAALPDGCAVDGDMVVRGRLSIGAGCVVGGSIKAYGSVDLGPGTRLDGSCFAHGRIHLGRDSRVHGQLSSRTAIAIGDGCIIGRPGRPSSTIAPEIVVSGSCRLHGSVWARSTGRTVPA